MTNVWMALLISWQVTHYEQVMHPQLHHSYDLVHWEKVDPYEVDMVFDEAKFEMTAKVLMNRRTEYFRVLR